MQRSLEASLAKKRPTSPYHVALSLGFVGERTLKRKFPDLCREIQKKLDAQKALDIASMERALIGALTEDPPPSLGQLCERMDIPGP